MADETGDGKEGKKNLTIRDVPLEDHAALERMRKRLRMPREQFSRTLLHLAIWKAPSIFERDLAEALGPEGPSEEVAAEEGAAEA